MTIWYAPTPTRWVLCHITSDLFGRVSVELLSNDAVKDFGPTVSGLKKRPITGAWICEK